MIVTTQRILGVVLIFDLIEIIGGALIKKYNKMFFSLGGCVSLVRISSLMHSFQPITCTYDGYQ